MKQFLLLMIFASIALAQRDVIDDHVDHGVFDKILRDVVRDERIDYTAVREKHLKDLKAYLDRLDSADVSRLKKEEQLAFYSNLYNATMIKAIVDQFHDGYSTSENDFKVFKDPLVHLGGKTISLNDLENQVIRGHFKEPRIHVALVCGARSCPPILPRAYQADDLDKVLDENMKKFINDPQRNQIDEPNRTLRLSKIFDWYADDFGGKDNIAKYIGKYAGKDLSGYKITFLNYSWDLNDASHR